MFDKIVTKVNAVDHKGFALKFQSNNEKLGIENKTSKMMLLRKYLAVFDLLKTDYNTKITEIKGIISTTVGLATTAAINVVENKISVASNLVKKQAMMQK